MTDGFRCDHPFTQANQVKIGGGRVGCRICRTAMKGRTALVRRANQTIANREGLNLADPKRADKALRRFSWEVDR